MHEETKVSQVIIEKDLWVTAVLRALFALPYSANGGSNAAQYINKVRARAGAQPLSGAVTVRTVLEERGRELCGEYSRHYDLKRTGMFKDNSYLQETHPDLATFFKPEYALRPIPTGFIQALEGGGSYYQNPGY